MTLQRSSPSANKTETTAATAEASGGPSNSNRKSDSSDKSSKENTTSTNKKTGSFEASGEKQCEGPPVPPTTGLKVGGIPATVFKHDLPALQRANKRIRHTRYLGDNQPDPEKWAYLDAQISAFCDNHFKGISWDELDEPTRKMFNDWAPNARRLFNSKIISGPSVFFQSWMWRILDQHIFANKTHELIRWKHPFYKIHNDLRLHLLENDPGLPNKHDATEIWHHWKWATTALFGASIGYDPVLFEPAMLPGCIEDVLRREMTPYFPKSFGKYQKRTLTCLSELAAEVEVEYSITVADVHLRFCHPDTKDPYGFPADSGDIELVSGLLDFRGTLASRLVELVVVPALEWRGRFGYDYDKCFQLCKMRVVPSLDEKEAHEDEDGAKESEKKDTGDKHDENEDFTENAKDKEDGKAESSDTQSNGGETEPKAD